MYFISGLGDFKDPINMATENWDCFCKDKYSVLNSLTNESPPDTFIYGKKRGKTLLRAIIPRNKDVTWNAVDSGQ